MTGKVRPLGHLQEIDVRKIWTNEASFTAWLAKEENVARLGQALEIDLEVKAQEKKVGEFRADIVCRDRDRDETVVIENQLERTDHSHLGQLITYAAGLKAVTIVWVSPEISEERRTALEWLNTITSDRLHCFGVQIGAERIGRSEPAPRFSVVIRPNGWKRFPRRPARAPKGTPKTRFEYWQSFLEGLRQTHPGLKAPRPNTLGNLRFTLRGNDLWITVYAASSLGRIGVFLKSRTDDFRRLYSQRSGIEADLGELGWDKPDSDGYWHVALSRDADPKVRDDWPAQHRWLADKLNGFLTTIVPKLK